MTATLYSYCTLGLVESVTCEGRIVSERVVQTWAEILVPRSSPTKEPKGKASEQVK